jgi:hypothetical protein
MKWTLKMGSKKEKVEARIEKMNGYKDREWFQITIGDKTLQLFAWPGYGEEQVEAFHIITPTELHVSGSSQEISVKTSGAVKVGHEETDLTKVEPVEIRNERLIRETY